MAADHVERDLHHLFDVGGRLRGHAGEQVDGQLAFPNGAVDGAVDGLKPGGEEVFDLIVGLVDGAHAAGFLVAFAAQLHGGFGEGGGFDGGDVGLGRSCVAQRFGHLFVPANDWRGSFGYRRRH